MIERSGIVERANIEVQVLDEHCASTDTNIPRVVARHSRRRQGGGGQRHSDGKLPHSNSPFNLRYTSRQTRSEEHMSDLQSLMRNSYAVFCLKNKNPQTNKHKN